jgi:hypothetical protein
MEEFFVIRVDHSQVWGNEDSKPGLAAKDLTLNQNI